MCASLIPEIRNCRSVVCEDRYGGAAELRSEPEESPLDCQELPDVDGQIYFLWSPKVGSNFLA